MSQQSGRVALVSAGSRGIGAATVRTLSLHVPLLVATAGYLIAIAVALASLRR